MPVANPKKTIHPTSIPCGGTATVTLQFRTAASLALDPADILLILDRSSSLSGDTLTLVQDAAKHFIDMVDGAKSGAVRLGLESFADTATQDVILTDEFSLLKPAVDALTATGTADHQAAWVTAERMLDIPNNQRKVAVMFTASTPAPGSGADAAVQVLKSKGVEIFCIGLGIDSAPLNLWATEPDTIHAAHTDDPAQLNQVFRKIGEEVVLAGVRDGVIQEKLMPDFQILKIQTPTVGTAEVTGPQSLTWNIGSAGIKEQPNFESISFDIMHVGTGSGQLPVNHSVLYRDREGNTLECPSPTVEVIWSGGGIEILPEPCPEPTEFTIPGCKDAVHISLEDAVLTGLGRIVQADVTLKAICPGKRVAASIQLMEVAPDGKELPRGVKHILVPAQEGTACQDITLKCIQFSLPEALDTTGNTGSICNSRQFTARVTANYVDTDFACCDAKTAIL